MKSFIVLALLVAAAVAAPASPDSEAQVLVYESDNSIEGHRYNVKTSNGIEQSEEGQLTNPGTDDEGYEVRGQYSFIGPDGITYLVTYTAGKGGFQPEGAHIPQPQL